MRSGLVALLLAGGACADDAPSLTTLGGSETDGDTTTDSPTTGVTTIEPDSSGGSMGMDSGDTTRGETTEGMTTAPTTDSMTTTDGGAVCGNGMIEAGEDCESEDLGGEDCASQGFSGGVLLCADDCTFDTSQCTATDCGNGAIDGTEDCDGADLGGASCQTEGFDGGTLACAANCTFDTNECTVAACGDGAIDAGEACDGAALNGETCVTQGFAGGNLACSGDCLGFDTSGCMNGACTHDICVAGEALVDGCDPCVTQVCAADDFCCTNSWDDICVGEVTSVCGIMCGGGAVCGDGAITAPEACDGANLNGQDCVSQGFAGGGVLACAGDCASFDTAGCNAGACAHDICVTGAALANGCDPCVTQVCAADGFCCTNSWDNICVGEVTSVCGIMCGGGAVCGDGAITAPEACDGANLNGQDCVSQGFAGGGVLACAGDCASFDTAGCNAGGGGDCCAAHAGTGCDNAACEASVCAADGFCCTNQWDGICANEAIADPNCAGVGGSCPGAAVCGDGAVTAPEVCDGANLNGQTCVSQGFAGGGVLACGAGCNAFNTAGCLGGGFACQDQDLGSAIGAAVAMGTTVGEDNDLNPSCGAGDALDRVFRFVAPAAASYTFTTAGSGFDTVLALFSDCATQLSCNDDSGGTLQSSLQRNMAAGEVVLILVDGYNGATGNYVLNISSP